MIVFAPAKINLGLHITGKRDDGFHEIESVMIPIPIYDIIEILESDTFTFRCTGDISVEGNNNLCEQAFKLIKNEYNISPVYIHLRKQIPIGAGLGGGSSDAAFVLKALNQLFDLNMSNQKLKELSAILGSDCPFFIDSEPQLAKGRGELLEKFSLDLSDYSILLIYPKIHISTREAYGGITSYTKRGILVHQLNAPRKDWPMLLKNDFESSVFRNHPLLQSIKDELYEQGAQYASLSGSGSTVFGLFKKNKIPTIPSFKDFSTFKGEL